MWIEVSQGMEKQYGGGIGVGQVNREGESRLSKKS